MKKANGNGSVSKLSGIRRKPYIARVTLGWDESTGRQIRKTIGTYVTQKEAQKALIDYLDNPYDLDLSNILFKDVYEKWSKLKYPKVSHSAILGYQSAYNNVEKLHNMKIKDIKARHLQEAIDSCSKGQATKKKIKFLFGQMFAYAMQNDIITKDYSEFVDIGKASEESKREPFSNKEIELLWKHIDDIEFIDTILIMIYSGFRIGELLELETKNIDLVNMTMTGGLKTEAGKNRLVPIHPKIFPLKEKFIPIMEQLNMEHRPHDCRHTFATLLSNANANATAIKKMIGHESYATTEKIYTHKDIEELRKNVELIK